MGKLRLIFDPMKGEPSLTGGSVGGTSSEVPTLGMLVDVESAEPPFALTRGTKSSSRKDVCAELNSVAGTTPVDGPPKISGSSQVSGTIPGRLRDSLNRVFRRF